MAEGGRRMGLNPRLEGRRQRTPPLGAVPSGEIALAGIQSWNTPPRCGQRDEEMPGQPSETDPGGPGAAATSRSAALVHGQVGGWGTPTPVRWARGAWVSYLTTRPPLACPLPSSREHLFPCTGVTPGPKSLLLPPPGTASLHPLAIKIPRELPFSVAVKLFVWFK